MIHPIQLLPGVRLRCYTDHRFKQGVLSLQLLRPMDEKEAALNALLPAVLLRGCRDYPDMRSITQHLDDLYGAGMGAVVRRMGDYQTTGISCSFMEDKYAFPGDQVFAPLADFLYKMLRTPRTENGVFLKEYVESEKKNLIAAIESQKNDKRTYAGNRLRLLMCQEDSLGVPRLGHRKQVAAITPEALWAHYNKILAESPVELFYVGSQEPEQVAGLLKPLFEGIQRKLMELPPQTGLKASNEGFFEEAMEVAQGKLSMGFQTPITCRHQLFVPMQLMMLIFGGSNGKLFNIIREKMSLCYDIGGTYFSSKGFVTVSAGIDFDKRQAVQEQVLALLERCGEGDFTDAEFHNAKMTLISGLRASQDSPGAIESYYANTILGGFQPDVEDYVQAVDQATRLQVQQAAQTVRLNTVFFLKGVQ